MSKVKSLTLDRWTQSDLDNIRSVGNARAKELYDAKLPRTCKRVSMHTPLGLRKFLLESKYKTSNLERKNSSTSAASSVASSVQSQLSSGDDPKEGPDDPVELEGWMYKKGKDNDKWPKRWFRLRGEELSYFINATDAPHEPKATLNLKHTTPILRCEKNFRTRYGMQLAWFKGDGPEADVTNHVNEQFRNIFVAADDGDTLISWMNAIRHNKAIALGLKADLSDTEKDNIVAQLSWEAMEDGFLWKTGPDPTSEFRQRWFSLFNDRILYFKMPLDPHPRGIIQLTAESEVEMREDMVPEGHCFEVRVPDRVYTIRADTADGAVSWVAKITKALNMVKQNAGVEVCMRTTAQKSEAPSIDGQDSNAPRQSRCFFLDAMSGDAPSH